MQKLSSGELLLALIDDLQRYATDCEHDDALKDNSSWERISQLALATHHYAQSNIV
jgi:hypothetical protein